VNLSELKKEINQVDENDLLMLHNIVISSDQVVILGNGGSNSIASHTAQDYTKQLKVLSFTFSDPSRLTCYINDYGIEKAYAQFLSEFISTEKTLVILISSSGESVNILNSADYCLNNDIPYIVLSGFKKNNQLKSDYGKSAKLNFWVNSEDYGIVEIVHQIILHAIL
tara:strand:+ start:1194 stop:1697 length:504 start_codon:yes stop_codon:yes gene_type:complete